MLFTISQRELLAVSFIHDFIDFLLVQPWILVSFFFVSYPILIFPMGQFLQIRDYLKEICTHKSCTAENYCSSK